MNFVSNAAVFINGIKQFANTNVLAEDGMVLVKARNDGALIQSFNLIETVGNNDRVYAWDISDPQRGEPNVVRMVAVVGCGCGGVPPYPVNQDYSGRL